MSDQSLTLLCLVDGERLHQAFPIEIDPIKTVHDLKNLIRTILSPQFDSITAKDLIIRHASIAITDIGASPLINALDEQKILSPTVRLSRIFTKELPEETIHIIIQRSQALQANDPLHLEVSALRQKLQDVADSSISIGVAVKPDKKIAFTWSTEIDDATLDDLKARMMTLVHPHYAHDDNLEVFVYHGKSAPEPIPNDIGLRKVLKFAKTASLTKLTFGMETPTKSFATWSFADVCSEYNITSASDPSLGMIPPFTNIQTMPLESDIQKVAQNRLINEVDTRVRALSLLGANEATKSMIVGSFLAAATMLYEDDLYLVSQYNLTGRRGHGPVDFSIHSRKGHDYTLGVTEVKKENFRQGVAQNIVQLESALTERKRKRETDDVDGDGEEIRGKQVAYGIVTDSQSWAFLECTLDENDTVSYRMSMLPEFIKYTESWESEVISVFEKIVWLWSRMVDEFPARSRTFRKQSSSPIIKRMK